jgi:hypothetical protein
MAFSCSGWVALGGLVWSDRRRDRNFGNSFGGSLPRGVSLADVSAAIRGDLSFSNPLLCDRLPRTAVHPP